MDPKPTPYESYKRINDQKILEAERAQASIVEAYPRKITVELTGDCNASCPHCWYTPARLRAKLKDPHRIWHLPFGDVERFARVVFPHIRYLNPSLVSEPLLYPQWSEVCDLVAEYGVLLEMTTNASLMTREVADRTLPVTKAFRISMDGGSRESFNHYRAGTDFDDVCRKVRNLCETRGKGGPEVWIKMTLMRGWLHELPSFVPVAKSLGVDGLLAGHLIPASAAWEKKESLVHEKELCRTIFDQAVEIADGVGLPIHLPASSPYHRVHSSVPLSDGGQDVDLTPPTDHRFWCKYLWREAFVAINGEVSPCCAEGRPVLGKLVRGEDLWPLWNAETIQEMRAGLNGSRRHEACSECIASSMRLGKLEYTGEGVVGVGFP